MASSSSSAIPHDEEEEFPISDEDLAEMLQLEEAMLYSSLNHSNPVTETPWECSICMEQNQEMFINNGCGHSFCSDCISRHVAAKIQENIMMVRCPDLNCKGIIELQDCRKIVPKQVLDRWEEALCESIILVAEKFYCPFKDCSGMMVADGGGGEGVVVAEAECPHCRRLFCAQCKVAWHAGIECRVFQGMNENERKREDIELMQLAHSKDWKSCPMCNIFVEKNEGCSHITCRCGHEFCYVCGANYSNTHICPPRIS